MARPASRSAIAAWVSVITSYSIHYTKLYDGVRLLRSDLTADALRPKLRELVAALSADQFQAEFERLLANGRRTSRHLVLECELVGRDGSHEKLLVFNEVVVSAGSYNFV